MNDEIEFKIAAEKLDKFMRTLVPDDDGFNLKQRAQYEQLSGEYNIAIGNSSGMRRLRQSIVLFTREIKKRYCED